MPQVVFATTAFGGAILVLDFNVPMMEETPEASINGNNMYWNVGGTPYSCFSEGGTVTYVWNSPTQVAISSNSDSEAANVDTCVWIPDELSVVRLRSVEGVYLPAFNDFPIE